MLQINNITQDAKQKHTLVLSDGTSAVLELEYKPQQLSWFITSLAYKTFLLQGFRISTSPNCLRQYRNVIPFGLGCFVQDNEELTLQTDFSSGRASLVILTSDEVAYYEDVLSGKV